MCWQRHRARLIDQASSSRTSTSNSSSQAPAQVGTAAADLPALRDVPVRALYRALLPAPTAHRDRDQDRRLARARRARIRTRRSTAMAAMAQHKQDGANASATTSSSMEQPDKRPTEEQAMERNRTATRDVESPHADGGWVQRVVAAHHRGLEALGVERQAFPTTQLAASQVDALLAPLLELCAQMTLADFGLRAPTRHAAKRMSGVHYWKLWESDSIDIGIFFLAPDAVIPLHNHPGMSVVSRILYGSAQMTSFELLPPREAERLGDDPGDDHLDGDINDDLDVPVEQDGAPVQLLRARVSREEQVTDSSTMWLDPDRFNLHRIQAGSEIGCALLDIMVPPYNNSDRDCHYFEIMSERVIAETQERLVLLRDVRCTDKHDHPAID